MERTPVSSTQISSVGYDKTTQTLEVEFARGGVYQYFDVSEGIYESLLHADSIGRHFHAQIRGVFNFKKVG